jgi:hypothetical protein
MALPSASCALASLLLLATQPFVAVFLQRVVGGSNGRKRDEGERKRQQRDFRKTENRDRCTDQGRVVCSLRGCPEHNRDHDVGE